MATEAEEQMWEIIKRLSFDEFQMMKMMFAPARDEDE